MGKKSKKNKSATAGSSKVSKVSTTEATAENTNRSIEVYIEMNVFNKIMHWVNKSNNEVSGFGNVVYDAANKRFTVVDAFLLEQYNTGSTTEIEATSLGKMMHKHFKFGSGALKWWWHSHVNMGVFWSGTDESTIRTYGANGYIVASVFNKRQEIRTAVCYKSEHPLFGNQLNFVDNVTTKITYPAAWDEEYAANVKERVYTTSSYTSNYHTEGYAGRGGANRTEDNSTIDKWRENQRNRLNTSDIKGQENVEEQRALKSKFTGDLSEWKLGKTYVNGIGYVWKTELEEATKPSKEQSFNHSEKTKAKNMFVNGLLGDYGLEAEAEALKMTVGKYEEILATGDDKQLDELQDKLTTLEQAGHFEQMPLTGNVADATNEEFDDSGFGEQGV